MRTSTTLALALALALASSPLTALAHGGEPVIREVVDHPGEGFVAVTNFGVMRSSAPGHYVCEEAFQGSIDFLLGAFGPDEWVMASRRGLTRTEDGCSFQKILAFERRPVALATHAPSGRVALATNDASAPGRVLVSEDRGRTFAPLTLPGVEDVALAGVVFLGERELLVSGYVAEQAGAGVMWRVPLDGGAPVSIDAPGGYPHLLDSREGVVAGVATVGPTLHVFVGEPGSLDLALALDVWPSGMKLSERDTVLVTRTTLEEGALLEGARAGSGEWEWEELEATHSSKCLGLADDALWLCARLERDGHDLATFEGGEATAVVALDALEGPVDTCPAGSDVERTCPDVWPDLERVFTGEPPPPVDAPEQERQGGCHVAGGPVGATSPLMWAALLGVSRMRRRRGVRC